VTAKRVVVSGRTYLEEDWPWEEGRDSYPEECTMT